MKATNKFIHMSTQWLVMLFLSFSCSLAVAADTLNLIDVKTRSAPGNKAQILLEFSGPAPTPANFSLHDPAKMIFDFSGVKNDLSKKLASQKISLGVMTAVKFLDSGSTTRLIIDVLNVVPYQIDADLNRIVITLDNDVKTKSSPSKDDKNSISAIDFRRGEAGEGRLVVDFANETVPVDFREDGKNLIVEFRGATIAESLIRRFDVKDFATNIEKITVQKDKDNVVLNIETKGDFDKIAYQLDKQFIVEVRPFGANGSSKLKAQKVKFSGEKISLNFQDIEVRSVLQLIADFAGQNMVISDSVNGNVTLRLDNVPWDQALDFILSSRGLSKRESGNVMLIAPNDEITAREQVNLETQQQVESLSPLDAEYIQINYAKAADMVTMIKSTDSNLLSSRGQVSVDARTNTLLIKDTAENLASVRELIEHLDIPVRQVMIEAQIVETTDSLKDALGIQFTGAATGHLGKPGFGIAPTMTRARQFADTPSSKTTKTSGGTSSSTSTSGSTTGTGSTNSSSSTGAQDIPPLFFDFSTPDANSILGFALAKLPGGTLLDLELQAAESEVKSKILARPKLMTLDQQQASIETGEDIPFTTTAQQGSTPTTTFKKAVLKLDVTPHITPNDKISMALSVNNDSPGLPINGSVAINTTAMKTNVLVDNGETIVLGGIFKKIDSDYIKTVPYLSEIPLLGRLFSSSGHNVDRTEILIFVTPRIVKSLFGK